MKNIQAYELALCIYEEVLSFNFTNICTDIIQRHHVITTVWLHASGQIMQMAARIINIMTPRSPSINMIHLQFQYGYVIKHPV